MYEEAMKHFAEILRICRERNMKLPFIICAASPKRTVFCMRFNGPRGEPEVLAQHREPDGFKSPINWIVLDQNGEAVRVTVDVRNKRDKVSFN
jgi:hypothetical protein